MDTIDWLCVAAGFAALLAFGPFQGVRSMLLTLGEEFEAQHKWASPLLSLIGLAALIVFTLLLPNEPPHG